MEPIIINYHSFVDLITNSSTEIYISCHTKTIEYLKEFIDSLLKTAGSDKKAVDLFDFKVMKKVDFDGLDESDYSPKEWKKLEKEASKSWGEVDKECVTKEDFESENDDYEDHNLIIIPKDKNQETIDLVAQITKIFNIEGSFNG